ncbi:hypothetical protein V22_41210 [Calycomorphotria hydatis]|uniref:Uncharacterized protein n=2 Tax=Calycomorphotria hydatis TaxID=2528027 RepID=A0A517TER0_9PLAN|nr:hypothetical protein V22_41210 [Calycomorphotria hydatis]
MCVAGAGEFAGRIARQPGIIVWIVISILMLGVPATAEAATRKLIGSSAAGDMVMLLQSTLPLVGTVMLVTLGFRMDWWERCGGPFAVLGVIAGIGYGGYLCGLPTFPEPMVVWPISNGHGLWEMLLFGTVNQLAGYLNLYGITGFSASIIAGVYLGSQAHASWVATMKWRENFLEQLRESGHQSPRETRRRAA